MRDAGGAQGSARWWHHSSPMRLLPVLPLLLFSAACRSGDADTPFVVRTDSAGVRLITSSAPDTALGWAFDEIDVLRDADGAPWVFDAVTRDRVLTDRAGRTYAISGDSLLVRFARDGRRELVLGERGDGPGQFRGPAAIGAKVDTLWVRDTVKGVFVRFLPTLDVTDDLPIAGAFVGAEAVQHRIGGLWYRRRTVTDSLATVQVLSDTVGTVMLEATVPVGATGPLFPMTAAGARLLVADDDAYTLWLYEGPRVLASIRRTGAAAPPYAYDVAVLPDATMWVQRTPPGVSPAVVDHFRSDGSYAGTTTGWRPPLAIHPNGELLIARPHESGTGEVIARVKLRRK